MNRHAPNVTGPSTLGRVRGCLLGGAIGDALGGTLEFLSGREIRERYGDTIAMFVGKTGRPIGAVTDDTQMTLFTAEGLIRAHAASSPEARGPVDRVVHHAYMRWLATQGYRIELVPGGLDSGWLVHEPWLNAQRAPGSTCLTSLQDATVLGEPASNDSKGCGGVMRIAPVGLVAADAEQAFDLGVRCAALTHGHPSGHLAAGHLAATISGLRDGAGIDEALDAASALLASRDHGDEVADAVGHARRLAAGGPSADAVPRLGQGWVAEEALAIAVYCALVAEDFVHGASLAVVHDGDSDSTGAVTGNLLGTMWGEESLPPHLAREVEGAATIVRLADDLYAGPVAGTRSAADLAAEYPGY